MTTELPINYRTYSNSFHTNSTSGYYLWTLIPMHEKVWVVSHSTCCKVLVDYHFEQENVPSIFVGKRLNSVLDAEKFLDSWDNKQVSSYLRGLITQGYISLLAWCDILPISFLSRAIFHCLPTLVFYPFHCYPGPHFIATQAYISLLAYIGVLAISFLPRPTFHCLPSAMF